MQISGYNDVLGAGEVKIPVGVDATTPDEKDLYRATLEFERFFVRSMLEKAEASTSVLGGDDEDAAGVGGSTTGYKDMARDQMTQAVLDGGGLGIAAVLYEQMRGQVSGGGATG